MAISGPFHKDNMLETHSVLWPGRLPVALNYQSDFGVAAAWKFPLADTLHCVLYEGRGATHQLLFGSDALEHPTSFNLSIMLPCTMELWTWRQNVQYFETRFNIYRHDAITRPSLETFSPLTLLRRNIAHLEEAVLDTKQRNSDFTKWEYDNRRETTKSNLGSLDDQYDALLQRIKTLSISLNNEIQLVIGSVTVQVSSTS